YDAASKTPLFGATISIPDSRPFLGTVTDTDGRFRLTNVPIGRIRVKITSVGYEDLLLNEVVLNAGKEVVLDLPLTESVTNLSEVKVAYNRSEDRLVTNNENVTVSGRPFNAAETARYAGSFGDPSRMAANFAGVSGSNDSRNDIVVRGNSPASLLWRLDGVNIPNPNHFGALGTSGGPVSMLNNNLLAKSDFLTGAFPGEYANAVGSVFDVKLRRGNDEKHEFLTQVGFNGVEVGAEGPLSQKANSQGRRASYLVNYRYSVFALLQNVGFQIAGVPKYQDFTFKTDIPVGQRGNLSMWTLGGRSQISFLGKDVDTEKPDAYGDENTNTRVKYFTGIGSIAYEHRFTDRTYGKLTVSGSRTTPQFQGDTVIYRNGKEIAQEISNAESEFSQNKLSINAFLSHKISAKDKVSGGVILDMIQYDLQNRQLYPVAISSRNATGETSLLQIYSQWKHRFNTRMTLNTGLNLLRLQLNGSTAVEPRAGLSYQLSPTSSINAGYGLHSQMHPILTYFYQTKQPNGTYALTNKNLDFTRSHHAVVGYERLIGGNLRLKLEAYNQWIFNAPVEQTSSYYSLLTEGANFTPIDKGNLVNKGTGRNYGVEMTLERFFTNNYYFLLTTSLFESKYKGSDGIERNTPFNNRYVVNLLTGREFQLGRNNVFSINWKITTAGGRFITPINLEQSAAQGQAVNEYDRAFSNRQTPYFRTDLKIGYKINRARMTHEIAFDLQNLTNNQNVLQQAYNPRTNRIGTAYQQGFLPVPFYRLTF
ncbi:MAG: TonB-dependent receptor, partial [Cytophagaceae bacterium]|nr:TonB-dependent receptor [Cytophagaceae bacterium]